MNSNIKIGISAKFHEKAPVFYGGETNRHIQYLETSIAKWIAQHNALPFMIPSESDSTDISAKSLNVRGFAEEMDALILQGGVDVHPKFYNEVPKQSDAKYDIVRDQYELELIGEFIKLKKPIFGICRGLQLLNTYFGGKLYHDLEESGFQKHFSRELESQFYHKIKIAKDGYFSHLNIQDQEIVSVHHQGIQTLGQSLQAEAYASIDNLIEAFSKIDEDHFVVAVQWHPELDNLSSKKSEGSILFHNFLQVTRNRKFYGDLSFDKKKKIPLVKSNELTLGVELELQIVDENNFDLSAKAPDLINELKNKKIKSEIFQSMIEVETGICLNAHEVEKDLQATCSELVEVAKKHKVKIASSGTHPFAKTTERKLTNAPRYRMLVESKQWIARRIAIFGLHCHVGTQNSNQAIQLYRFYLSMSPLFLGISSSSPFFESELTGLQSVRSTFFESIPSGGHPPALSSWNELEGLLAKMYKSKAISSHKDLWWDVRPSLTFGTIEIRICDMMPTLKENVSLVALIQLLGRCYLDDPENKIWPRLDEWSYRENKWRALRYGVNFNYIYNEQGDTISSTEYLNQIFQLFENQIHDLSYEKYILFIKEKMLEKSPAEKMMANYQNDQDLSKIVEKQTDQFYNSILN